MSEKEEGLGRQHVWELMSCRAAEASGKENSYQLTTLPGHLTREACSQHNVPL